MSGAAEWVMGDMMDTPQQRACGHCGLPTQPGVKFCGGCGRELTAPLAASVGEPAPPVAGAGPASAPPAGATAPTHAIEDVPTFTPPAAEASSRPSPYTDAVASRFSESTRSHGSVASDPPQAATDSSRTGFGAPSPEPTPMVPRRQTTLIATLVVILVILVAVVVVLATRSSHPKSSTASEPTSTAATGGTTATTAPTTVAPTTTSPPTTTAVDLGQQQAQSLGSLVAQSASNRGQIVAAVNDIENCGDFAQDQATLEGGASARQSAIDSASRLEVTSIPGGPTMIASLTAAWQASLQSDNSYAAWAGDLDGTICIGKATTNDANFRDAQATDATADATKAQFVQQWNPVAATYGLPQYQPNQI